MNTKVEYRKTIDPFKRPAYFVRVLDVDNRRFVESWFQSVHEGVVFGLQSLQQGR